MKKAKILFYAMLAAALLSGCSSTLRTSVTQTLTPLPPNTVVDVIDMKQSVPDGAKLVGHVKIGDSGFSTNCSYTDAIYSIQEQARGMGGNLVQITKHKKPSLASTCHRVWADVYIIKK